MNSNGAMHLKSFSLCMLSISLILSQGAANTAEFDYFDKVYYKKGKVFIFPDILVPKPKLYKKETTREVSSPAGEYIDLNPSRRQGSASQDAESHADKTTGDVSESQQQAQGKGERSTETSETPSSVDAANRGVPKSSQKEKVKDLANSEDGQKGERQGKKTKIKEPKSYVLDEEKLKDENVQEQLRGEECECLVLQQIKAALEEDMGTDDPPIFILRNLNLAVTVEGKLRTKIEQDVLILHPTLGVILVQVMGVKSRTSFSRFDGGTEQLLRAKECVLEEMGELLEEDATVLAIALPELQPGDASVIRQRAQELPSSAERRDVTAGTASSADKTGKGGEKELEGTEGVGDPKFKGTALLKNHPEIHLLCGSTEEVFTDFVKVVRQLRAVSGHAFRGTTDKETEDNFKRACIRHLSSPGLRPGQSVKDSVELHHRFLLTKEQLQVRDSKAELLHLWGPPGCGKTLLLLERARRWLREGRHLVLAVRWQAQSVLLRYLVKNVCGEKPEVENVTICKHAADLQKLVDGSLDKPVSIILDEAMSPDNVYPDLLKKVKAGRVLGLWTAYTRPLPDKLKAELMRSGGSMIHLRFSFRCPPNIIALTNNIRSEQEPLLQEPPVPVTRQLGAEVEVICHHDHAQSLVWDACPQCGEGAKSFFSSLGIQGHSAKSALSLRDVVVITTSERCDRERVAERLRNLELPALADTAPTDNTSDDLTSGATPVTLVEAEMEMANRVLRGEDREGRPVIHVVDVHSFRGMEKPIVVLWHEDIWVGEMFRQKQKDRDPALSLHRNVWYQAASRCQGRLLIMAATPSPLLSLLQAPSPSLDLPIRNSHVVFHKSHSQKDLPYWQCGDCGQALVQRLQSLGLPLLITPAPDLCRQILMVLTGWSCDGSRVATWLRELGLPAVFEEPQKNPESKEHSQTEVDKWLVRVKAGKDSQGHPALHVVQNLCRLVPQPPVIVLIHHDNDDNHSDLQSKERRDDRLQWHRYCWNQALVPSQQVLVLATTPSPLLALLRPPSPTMGELAAFDQVYNRKGKILIFPDVVEPKVKFFKRSSPSRPPPSDSAVRHSRHSRKQQTTISTSKTSAGETSDIVSENRQQGGQERRTDPSKTVQRTLQDKSKPRSSKQGPTERMEDRMRIKHPPSFVLDEEELKRPDVQRHLKGEEYGILTLQLVKAALEEISSPEDTPVIILHNQDLVVKTSAGRSEGENNLLVLHPTLGVLVLEVKGTEKTETYSRFDKATTQLLHAQTSIQEEMGDLLEKDGVVLTVALPCLAPEASSIIRKEAQERKLRRLNSDGTVQAALTAEISRLEDHPEILLLCGSTPEVCREWVQHLIHLRATSGHAFKGSTAEERLRNFKRACSRRLSVPSLRPGQSAKDSADLHRRFLLTEEQLRVRDSQAKLLHISGSCGSGKTLLLVERARRWLREGHHVALAVGSPILDLLLRHLTGTVCGVKADIARLTAHSGYLNLLPWLYTTSVEDPVYVIVDEAAANFPDLYDELLDLVRAGRVGGLWSADTRPLPDRQEENLHSLGGSTARLSQCLRSPPHVMSWINSVKLEEDLPLLPPLVPVTRELGVGVEVISHADHPHSQSWDICSSCREDTKAFFASLGLQEDPTTSALQLSDVVVITTGEMSNKDRVARWLRGLGLHAVAEKTWGKVTPVLSSTPESPEWAEEEAQRSRVLKGVDVQGKPAIHVVEYMNFQGLEKPVVLLWHEDRNDEGQGEVEYTEGDDFRLLRHHHQWFMAATRCQGRLAVMATTPSPLLSLLRSTSTLDLGDQLRHTSLSPAAQDNNRGTDTRHVRGEGRTQSPPPSSSSPPPPAAPAFLNSSSLRPPPEALPCRPAPSSSGRSGFWRSGPFPASSAPSEATPSHSFTPFSAPSGVTPSYHLPSSPAAAFGAMPFPPFSVPYQVTPFHPFPSTYGPFGAMPSHTYPPPSAPFGAMPSNPLPPFPHPGAMPTYAIPSFFAPPLAPPQATFPSHLHPETSSPTRPPGQAAPSPSRESKGAFKY